MKTARLIPVIFLGASIALSACASRTERAAAVCSKLHAPGTQAMQTCFDRELYARQAADIAAWETYKEVYPLTIQPQPVYTPPAIIYYPVYPSPYY